MLRAIHTFISVYMLVFEGGWHKNGLTNNTQVVRNVSFKNANLYHAYVNTHIVWSQQKLACECLAGVMSVIFHREGNVLLSVALSSQEH